MKRLVFAAVLAGALLVAVAATAAVAHKNNGGGKTKLESYQEVPTLSTAASGSVRIRVRSDGIQYRLKYSGFTTPVLQAHIHFGRTATNGGIVAFLCGPQPAAGDKPVCPQGEGTVEGTIDAADILAASAGTPPVNQGIAAGELTEVLRALRNGSTYANVHSQQYPGGEIRGQIRGKNGNGKKRDDD
jgi:hypothetical protein